MGDTEVPSSCPSPWWERTHLMLILLLLLILACVVLLEVLLRQGPRLLSDGGRKVARGKVAATAQWATTVYLLPILCLYAARARLRGHAFSQKIEKGTDGNA